MAKLYYFHDSEPSGGRSRSRSGSLYLCVLRFDGLSLSWSRAIASRMDARLSATDDAGRLARPPSAPAPQMSVRVPVTLFLLLGTVVFVGGWLARELYLYFTDMRVFTNYVYT